MSHCILCGRPETVRIVNTILAFKLSLCAEHETTHGESELVKLRASQWTARKAAVKAARKGAKDDDDFFDWAVFMNMFEWAIPVYQNPTE